MEIITLKSKFLKNLFDQNTYVVKNESGAILIDAGAEIADLLKALDGTRVYAILLTHVHFDHIWNIEEYIKEFDCDVYVCRGAEEKFGDYQKNCASFVKKEIVRNVRNDKLKYYQKELVFDDIKVDVYFTPGHCADCVCLKIDNALFSGDTLFANGIGRTDIFDSSEKDMKNSLNIIKNIDFEEIYPGHYESATKAQANHVIDCFL